MEKTIRQSKGSIRQIWWVCCLKLQSSFQGFCGFTSEHSDYNEEAETEGNYTVME